MRNQKKYNKELFLHYYKLINHVLYKQNQEMERVYVFMFQYYISYRNYKHKNNKYKNNKHKNNKRKK
jgi:hypothetical protein